MVIVESDSKVTADANSSARLASKSGSIISNIKYVFMLIQILC